MRGYAMTNRADCPWRMPARVPTAHSSLLPMYRHLGWTTRTRSSVKSDGGSDQTVVDAIAQGDSIESIEITGDIAELLAAQANRIEQWNAALS